MFALFVWLSDSLIPVYGWHFNAAPAQSQYGFEIPHLPCSDTTSLQQSEQYACGLEGDVRRIGMARARLKLTVLPAQKAEL